MRRRKEPPQALPPRVATIGRARVRPSCESSGQMHQMQRAPEHCRSPRAEWHASASSASSWSEQIREPAPKDPPSDRADRTADEPTNDRTDSTGPPRAKSIAAQVVTCRTVSRNSGLIDPCRAIVQRPVARFAGWPRTSRRRTRTATRSPAGCGDDRGNSCSSCCQVGAAIQLVGEQSRRLRDYELVRRRSRRPRHQSRKRCLRNCPSVHAARRCERACIGDPRALRANRETTVLRAARV